MTNAKYEAWMNGKALGDVSPDLFITGIAYKPASPTVSVVELAGMNGEMEGASRWSGATVTISFILQRSTEAKRQEIIQAVYAWAKRGTLEISDRPGKRLHVVCGGAPFVPDMLSWTNIMSVTLQTMEKPFWEEKVPVSIQLTAGTSGSGSLYVPGNAGKTCVEATVTPGSGSTMANCTLTVAGKTFTLTGVNATSSNPLRVTYDSRGILSIKVGTTSVLDKRSAASADDLLAECGAANAVSFTSSASATVVFSARGLWT